MANLNYSFYHSPVGILKMAADEFCIRELVFADNEDDIIYPAGNLLTPVLQQCTEQLIEFFNGKRQNFDIPVSQAGTTFQQRVWNELLYIPFGKTVSYADIARKLGDVNAVRAVGNTNGKNNICIIVPCHRVIGTNKSLVGYAGGLWRKKWLLQHEFKLVNGIQTMF